MNTTEPKCPFCNDGENIGEPKDGATKHVCQHCQPTECEFCEVDGSGNHAPRCPIELETEIGNLMDQNDNLEAKVSRLEQALREIAFTSPPVASGQTYREWAKATACRSLGVFGHGWSQEKPTHDGLWWWWNLDWSPIVVEIDRAPNDVLYVPRNQHGWNRIQSLAELGGYWMECNEPEPPTEPAE